MSELKQISCLRYICKTCGKTYKTLTWFNKHVEKFQHKLDPVELLNDHSEIDFLKCEINFLKRQFRELKASGSILNIDPIERIKQEEEQKIIDPALQKYRQAFKECIQELKDVLKLRKEKIDHIPIEIEQLELVMV